MRVTHLEHFNIRVKQSDTVAVRDFYVNIVGLSEGPRPNFPFPGFWLYGGAEHAILHIAATLADDAPTIDPARSTGQIDHVSLRSQGLVRYRAHLKDHGINFTERPVPGWRLTQIFMTDPVGLLLELTFDLEREDHTVVC